LTGTVPLLSEGFFLVYRSKPREKSAYKAGKKYPLNSGEDPIAAVCHPFSLNISARVSMFPDNRD
jgi:hypothetical protein